MAFQEEVKEIPLFSVIVPCYNQAIYLEECLQSVLDQTYQNWECIIVNDGSPDNTEEIAVQYCDKDKRFKYLKKQNGGLSSARNVGINISSGIYILPLDADDKISNGYCTEALAVLENNPSVKIVYAEANFFGEQTGRWSLGPYSWPNILLYNMIYCSAFFRKSDFEAYGGYDETLLVGMEDWDLWLGILSKGGEVFKLPDVHFFYRKKVDSMSTYLSANKAGQVNTRYKIFLKNHTLYLKEYGDPIFAYLDKRNLEIAINEERKKHEIVRHCYSFRLGKFILNPFAYVSARIKK